MATSIEVVEGEVRYDGRTLAEWVPVVASQIAEVCDPVQVILWGSLARGDDDPDSDIDLLVEFDVEAPGTRWERDQVALVALGEWALAGRYPDVGGESEPAAAGFLATARAVVDAATVAVTRLVGHDPNRGG
jgi:hypothetical protein